MPDLWLPVGPDPLLTHRVESIRVDLLNTREAVLGPLDGTTGGTIEQNLDATIIGGGTLAVHDTGQDVDWLNCRVRPWWVVGNPDDPSVSWPLGVYLCSAPVATYDDSGTSWQVELLDKLAVLDQDAIDGSYALPAGTVVTTAVRDVIESAGETAMAITASTETLPAGMVWPAGTSKLRICNDLLGVINYEPLRCDGYGRYVVAPYLAPADRPVTREFVAGAASIHLPDFTRDQDLAAIPNEVVLIGPGSSTVEALVGTATNTDPNSPYSYPSRGRWIVRTEQADATSQQVIDDLAARRLVELSTVSATVDVQHAAVPLDLGAVVRFTSGDVDARASVQRWSLDLAPGALMRTTLREVPV